MEKLALALFVIACLNLFASSDFLNRLKSLFYLLISVAVYLAGDGGIWGSQIALVVFVLIGTFFIFMALAPFLTSVLSYSMEDFDDFDD